MSIIHEEVNRLIGYEILEEGKDSCLIKDIQETSSKDFEITLRRIFLLINDLAATFTNAVSENDFHQLERMLNKHDTITRFISYCFRLLNKNNEQKPQLKFYYLSVLNGLEQITDAFKESSRNILQRKQKIPKEAAEIIQDFQDSINLYYGLFYKYDKQKAVELDNKRYVIENKMRAFSKPLNPAYIAVSSLIFLALPQLRNITSHTSILNLQ